MTELEFPEEVLLLLPYPPSADGSVNFRAVVARAHLLDRAQREPEAGGVQENARSFLLCSPEPPVPGAGLIHQGRRYDLRSVRDCRDLDGRPVAYRCLAV